MLLACRVATLLLVCLAWLLPPPLALAQQAAQTYVLPLGVYDKDGNLVTGLKPEQIRVKGVRATVHRLELDSGPRRIILLLDTSASMGEEPIVWDSAFRTVKEFVAAVHPDDRVALHDFSDSHRVLHPLTQNPELLVRELEALLGSGSKEPKRLFRGQTVLSQPIEQILSTDDSQRMFDQAVVIISDGGQVYPGNTSLHELVHRVVAAGVRIFLLVSPLSKNLGERPTGEMSMDEFVIRTGGTKLDPRKLRSITPPDAQDWPANRSERIRAMARATYRMIRNSYRLELEVADPVRKPRKLTLQVLDEKGRTDRSLQLFYPRYIAPLPTTR